LHGRDFQLIPYTNFRDCMEINGWGKIIPLRCFVWVEDLNLKYQQIKAKDNQILELENNSKNWKYYGQLRKTL